jgi:hypothetical protein
MPDKYSRVLKKGKLTVTRNTSVAEDLRDIVNHFSGGKSVLKHNGQTYDAIVDEASGKPSDSGAPSRVVTAHDHADDMKRLADKIRSRNAKK